MTRNDFVVHLLLRGFMQSAPIAPHFAYHIFVMTKEKEYARCISVYLEKFEIRIVEAGRSTPYIECADALKELDNMISEARGGSL